MPDKIADQGTLSMNAVRTPLKMLEDSGAGAALKDSMSQATSMTAKAEKLIKILQGGDDLYKEQAQGMIGGPLAQMSTVTTSVQGLPDKQNISMETMRYVQGAIGVIAALTPVWMLLQGVWQFMAGGGLNQLKGVLDNVVGAVGVAGSPLSQKASGFKTQAANALQAAGLPESILSDPKALNQVANTVTLSPIPGLTEEPMLLADVLNRLMTQVPAVAVPIRDNPPVPPSSLESPVEKITLPNGTVIEQTKAVQRIQPAAPPPNGLVNPNREEPPSCDLVSTNVFRHDPNPFKTFGNPVAAVESDVTLAQDLANIAGAKKNLADAAMDLKKAADNLRYGNARESLRLSIRSLIKGLVTFNFQVDSDGLATSELRRATAFWERYEPPAPTLDPEIIRKMAAGTALSQEEITAYNNATTLIANKAAVVAAPEYQTGALPGTLLYAALGDDPYTGALDNLLDSIPGRIAIRLGIALDERLYLDTILSNLKAVDDLAVDDIPAIIMGSDTRIKLYGPALRRWCLLLKSLSLLSSADVQRLSLYINQISGGPFELIRLVKATVLPYDDLYNVIMRHSLLYDDWNNLKAIASYWDSLITTISPNPNSQHPDALALVRDILAPVELLPSGGTIYLAVVEVQAGVLDVGGPLGNDLAQMVGVVGTLLRLDKLLKTNDPENAAYKKRIVTLLTEADTMSQPVEHFPNPGMLARIAEVV